MRYFSQLYTAITRSALFLALAFAMPLGSLAQTGELLTFTASGGQATLTSCSPSATGTVAVPAQATVGGNKLPVTAIGKRAFAGCTAVDSVVIGENVASVGDYAFDGCTALQAVTFNNTHPLSAGNCSWRGCKSLKRVHWLIDGARGGATSLGTSAFDGCEALEEFTIPGNVEQMGIGVFNGCDRLLAVTAMRLEPIYLSSDPFNGSAVATIYVPLGATTGAVKNLYERAAIWKKRTITELAYSAECFDGLRYRLTAVDGEAAVCGHRMASSGNGFVVTVPPSVTLYDGTERKLVAIDQRAFAQTAVTALDFSRATKLGEIGASAFEMCNSLSEVQLPEGLNKLGNNAFANCRQITSVRVPSTLNTLPAGAFKGCTALTDVKLLFGVVNLGDSTFARCTALQTIELPHSVRSILATTFNHTKSLKSVAVDKRNKNYASYAGILYAIKNDSIPTELVLYPAAKDTAQYIVPYGVLKLGDFAMQDVSALKSLVLPATLTTFGKNCLDGCLIQSINNRSLTPQAITTAALGTFKPKGAILYVPPKKREAYAKANVWKTFGSIVPRDSIISDGRFSYDWDEDGMARLTDVWPAAMNGTQLTIPHGITINEIHYPLADIGGHAFDQVAGTLQKLIVEHAELANLDEEINPFTVCRNLSSIDIDTEANKHFDFIDGVLYNSDTTMLYFYPGTRTNEVFITPTSTQSIYHQAFAGNTYIRELRGNTRLSVIGEQALEGCTALERISQAQSIATVGKRAFDGCTMLQRIDAGERIATLGDSAFINCKSLQHFALAHSFLQSIGTSAFEGCTSLRSVVGGRSLGAIGRRAYARCTALQLVTLSPSLHEIDDEAFAGCTALTDFRCRNFTPVDINSNVFDGIKKNACILSVPAGSSEYSSAAVWRDFTNQRAEFYIDNPADVNDDKFINVADVSLVYAAILGQIEDAGLTIYDVTRDGVVNVADVSAIYDYILRGENATHSFNFTYGSLEDPEQLPLNASMQTSNSLEIRVWNQMDEKWADQLSCMSDNSGVLSATARNMAAGNEESNCYIVNAVAPGYATAILQTVHDGVLYTRDFTVIVQAAPKSTNAPRHFVNINP